MALVQGKGCWLQLAGGGGFYHCWVALFLGGTRMFTKT